MHVKLSAPDAGLDKPVENISVENFVSSLQAHQAPVSNENLQRIILEHDKNRESVINVNYFFKGLKYLQKAFVISSYAPKQAKKGKGGKEKKSGKSASSLPICTMPPEQISIREDSGLPNYMIENYQPFTDTKRFNPDRPPIHPIENDLAWYIDEPEKIYTNINYWVKTGDLESLSLAFTQQVPVDVKEQFFKTPLMTACRCGNCQVAKFLWTPLHHDCHAGRVDITIMLVQSGAVVDAVAMNGATPLMRAIESCRFSCAEYLIKAGANVMAKNKREQNCLDIAINYGDARIIGLLMAKFNRKDKERKPEPTLKTPFSAQEKMGIRSPARSVSAAVKKDLRDNFIVKNPKFTIRSGTNKSDISFVPKTLWGRHLTNSPQHTKKKGTL
ncbi:ankyrin repeat and EF-hand domain-containing protein 1-like [Sinocyclocheilus rhinocerous]|uniref:ankyrin repeat and EF-hand domain-containing protein 1-like n=1 Tax=Sinocyclocheilus rhinocerous TaxID=307959 RepID=UPI0007BA2D18|nr:PREDICTED: ankyrin repeat and EF-hand domain-containing protein 1-like [Sinocyclocheilus rhinocerous]